MPSGAETVSRFRIVLGALQWSACCLIVLLFTGIWSAEFLGLPFSDYFHLQIFDREPQVPCYFIFGDSLADNGNNNGLLTQAKSNYPPYGVDFPKGPTGRFTNGRLIVDIIAQLLGFDDFIPPFANLTGADILKGVNYASAGSGIRDETGTLMGQVRSMNEQLKNHFTTFLRIVQILKSKSAAKRYLGKCIYTVIMGNNDYINNYFMPNFYPTSWLYNPQQFADVLVKQYSEQLKTLHSFGARKVAIFGVGQIGKTPEMVVRFGPNSYLLDAVAQLFDDKLQPLVKNLNSQLSDAEFIYIDSSRISSTIDRLNTKDSCCQMVPGLGTCVPGTAPCPDRKQYVFFDGFHPTEVVNIVIAESAYKEMLFPDAPAYDISRPSLSSSAGR